ncbi:MAG: GDSL-type esterase/lipase family protein [Pseudomonadota bacterium]
MSRPTPLLPFLIPRLLALSLALFAGFTAAERSFGVLFVLVCFLTLAAVLVLAREAAGQWKAQRARTVASRLLLSVLSLALVLTPLEWGVSKILSRMAGQDFVQRGYEDMLMKKVEVPGAEKAYVWNGALHVLDAMGMRRTTPFPPRDPSVFRIAALGDSLTYGMGVAEEDAWPAVLERRLAKRFQVEVLNLGVTGFQSGDLLQNLPWVLEQVRPDLLLYGVCLNDFLPSGMSQKHNGDYALPLPDSVKNFFIQRSRFCLSLAGVYTQALIRLGLRTDFCDDILSGFPAWRTRFASDALEMNRLAMEAGLPPIAALVLEQCPGLDPRMERLAEDAERDLKQAGMQVIPSRGYREKNKGRLLACSPWEGHPNEEAHAIFAGEIYDVLSTLPSLEKYPER